MRHKILKFKICICLAVFTSGGYFIIVYQIRTRSKDEITKLSEALATLTPSKFSDNDLSGYKVLYYFRTAVS